MQIYRGYSVYILEKKIFHHQSGQALEQVAQGSGSHHTWRYLRCLDVLLGDEVEWFGGYSGSAKSMVGLTLKVSCNLDNSMILQFAWQCNVYY